MCSAMVSSFCECQGAFSKSKWILAVQAVGSQADGSDLAASVSGWLDQSWPQVSRAQQSSHLGYTMVTSAFISAGLARCPRLETGVLWSLSRCSRPQIIYDYSV